MKTLRLGISTCPNDTFIYEYLIQGLPHSSIQWQVTYADVQTLNEMVLANQLDVAKVSCGVLALVQDAYQVLAAGGAIGYGCGPLLLSSKKQEFSLTKNTLLPGKNTTAAQLFRFWMAQEHSSQDLRVEYKNFDLIYRDLQQQAVHQGVVIHEHRFTWAQDGLYLLQDLGAYFELKTGAPIPLGCTVVSRRLSDALKSEVQSEIQKSLRLAQARSSVVTPYIKSLAKIESDEIIKKHIKMFVTDFSYDMGEKGKSALEILFLTLQK